MSSPGPAIPISRDTWTAAARGSACEIGQTVTCLPVATDGAAKAANLIAGLL